MGLKKGFQKEFREGLLNWHHHQNRRKMPWKGEKDPYKVWLSEVILQQTRVEQGTAYYERFIETYPTILALAQAGDEEVFKLWEGLGYYSRCRNLLHTAREISFNMGGQFPKQHDQIIRLKGIGSYTAAAIASFAFNLPYAVVDGNVIRIISRYFGMQDPVDRPSVRAKIQQLAQDLLDQESPASYNQAIMDLGATVCKPRQPLCENCPLASTCVAHVKNLTSEIPRKEKKLVRTRRYMHYILFEYDKKVYVRKRAGKDIWHGLFEFYLIEKNRLMTADQLVALEEVKAIAGKKSRVLQRSEVIKQQLTHQEINGIFLLVQLSAPPKALKSFTPVKVTELHKLPFPRFILSYMREIVVI